MGQKREKIQKIIESLHALYQDPHPGLMSWTSLEATYLQKLYGALRKVYNEPEKREKEKKTKR